MPRYYFDIHDGADYPDLQGLALADDASAREEAERLARALLHDLPERFAAGESWTITISSPREYRRWTLCAALPQRGEAERSLLEFEWLDPVMKVQQQG